MIDKNLRLVEENISNACKKSNRDRSEVTLIAVSKTKPIKLIEEVYALGVYDFGENKVQELMDKTEVLPNDISWHLIGHLQRNKVKYIIDKVKLIHSVDSIRLAEQISIEAIKIDKEVEILIQVNVSNEDSKFGLSIQEAEDFIRNVAYLKNIKVKGLMTIAPFTEDAEENRGFFKKLKQLSVDIISKNIDNVSMEIISMGMTGDYEVAIEEGATLVRVGTGIFGERIYE